MNLLDRNQIVGTAGGREPVGSDHPERLGGPPLAVGSSESIHPYGTHSKLWATMRPDLRRWDCRFD